MSRYVFSDGWWRGRRSSRLAQGVPRSARTALLALPPETFETKSPPREIDPKHDRSHNHFRLFADLDKNEELARCACSGMAVQVFTRTQIACRLLSGKAFRAVKFCSTLLGQQSPKLSDLKYFSIFKIAIVEDIMTDLRIFVKTLAKEADQETVKSACDKLKGYFNEVCKEAIKSSSGNRKGFTQSTVRAEPSVSEVNFKRGDVLVYVTKSDNSLLAMATSQTRGQEVGGVTGMIKGAVLCEVFWDKVPPIQKQSDWDMPATVLANLMFHELGHNKCTMGILVQTGTNEFQNKPVDMHATGGAILSAKHEIGQLMKAKPDAKDIRCLSQVLDNVVPQYTYYLSANSRIL